ncbi:MAP kinase-activated protein kinase 5-like [Corticium candelabrum]|uniref:MAP kinase-activated protein kinase 5-like n=1 Tax=Corticium candelabrum TaxID=121492 RepID=UPI002E25A050|nr:MAP kinase-activated protein kinase 5-like [Corticium candelabrum]
MGSRQSRPLSRARVTCHSTSPQRGKMAEEEIGWKSSRIDSDYTIDWDKRLGSGVSGPVRMCVKKSSGEKFALKILVANARTRQEVRLHCLCSSHPNVVSVVDVYLNEIAVPGELTRRKRILLVLELMEGGELFDRISRKTKFTEKEASSISKQIAEAVRHCHSLNVAHRDLKPENLLLKSASEDDVTVKLSDFGFAKMDQGDLTTPQFTPYYVSPQVLQAQQAQRMQRRTGGSGSPVTYDKSCDMWSVGVIIYIMLCGYPPFYSESPSTQLSNRMRRRIMGGEYDFPQSEWQQISANAVSLVKQLLVVDSTARFTAEEVCNHQWINQGTESNSVLHSPGIMLDKEAMDAAKAAHASQLMEMRMPDALFKLKDPLDAKNKLMTKRMRQSSEQPMEVCLPLGQASAPIPATASVKSLRDVVAFCLMPPPPSQAVDPPEKALGELVKKAVALNLECESLSEALRLESWDGTRFTRSIDRRRLATHIQQLL